MPSHKRHGPHRGGGHQPPPQPDVAAESAEHALNESKKPGLNITELKVGDQAPPFALAGSDGRSYRLADYAGKQVVVLAWFSKAFTSG